MTVRGRIKKDESFSKKQRDRMISRGADDYATERKKRRAITVRMPLLMLDELKALKARSPHISRSTIILQAIQTVIDNSKK